MSDLMNRERCWLVYVHTNKTNSKTYVGITSREVNARWQNGNGYKEQAFGKAIQKYGWDGFDHEIIASNLTEDEANAFEITLIRELDSHIKKNGYNVTEGGKGTKGCNVDRSQYKGSNATNKSPVICLNDMEVFECVLYARQKYNLKTGSISKCLSSQTKSCGSHNGERLLWSYFDATKDKEYYEKLREEKLLKLNNHKHKENHHASKEVICVNTGEVFKSCADATQKYKAYQVSEVCRGKQKSSGKHPITGEKLKWMYYEDYLKHNEGVGEVA